MSGHTRACRLPDVTSHLLPLLPPPLRDNPQSSRPDTVCATMLRAPFSCRQMPLVSLQRPSSPPAEQVTSPQPYYVYKYIASSPSIWDESPSPVEIVLAWQASEPAPRSPPYPKHVAARYNIPLVVNGTTARYDIHEEMATYSLPRSES